MPFQLSEQVKVQGEQGFVSLVSFSGGLYSRCLLAFELAREHGQEWEKAVSHTGAPDMTGGKRGIEESRVMLLIGFL